MDFRDHQIYPPNMMIIGPNPFPDAFIASVMMTPNTARFPLVNNNLLPHSDPYDDNNNNDDNNAINNESPKPCVVASEPFKRKRGRPRKHSPPDGEISSLALASTQMLPSSSSIKKSRGRGRPPGSGKKQLNALGGPVATSFTPHVLFVKPGQDVTATIMAFCEQARRTVIILSVNGKVGNVTLRHTTGAQGLVTYEGPYELISLSGSFPLPENNIVCTGMSEFSVSLGGLDGIVIGGGLVGKLTATSTVQVVMGDFLTDGKKPSLENPNFGTTSASSSQISTLEASVTPTIPPSQGPATESSNDNEKGTFSDGCGFYNNTSQPFQSLSMYRHEIWDAETQQWRCL